jgi:hypothetical protein
VDLKPAGAAERVRCGACAHMFQAIGSSPQIECPSCGVTGQRSIMAAASVADAPRQYPEKVTPLFNPFRKPEDKPPT